MKFNSIFTTRIQCCLQSSTLLSTMLLQLTEEVRHEMQATLQKVYGVNLDESWNRHVTDSWDKAQTEVR